MGASWIRDVVAVRAPEDIASLDTLHVIGWATTALGEVRRAEWNKLRKAGRRRRQSSSRRLRFLRRRDWEHRTLGAHHPRLPDLGRATIEMKFTNGIAESNNASIGRVRVNTCGFHDPSSVHHRDRVRPSRQSPPTWPCVTAS